MAPAVNILKLCLVCSLHCEMHFVVNIICIYVFIQKLSSFWFLPLTAPNAFTSHVLFCEDPLGQLTTPPKQDWRGAYDMDNTIMVRIRHVKVASLTNALAPLVPPHSQNAGAATDSDIICSLLFNVCPFLLLVFEIFYRVFSVPSLSVFRTRLLRIYLFMSSFH